MKGPPEWERGAPWQGGDARTPRHHHSDTGQGSAAFVAGLRRRRAASWSLPPLACGHRDPVDCSAPPPAGFGLTPGEAIAEAVRLRRLGWTGTEVRNVLGLAA